MPFFIPFIPALVTGVVAIATAIGGKKIYDAYKNRDEAEKVNKEAQSIYDNARYELDKERLSTQKNLEDLGKLKFKIYQNKIIPFQDIFSQIINLPKEIKINGEGVKFITKEELEKMKEVNLSLTQVVGGGITALGAGGLTGLAAYGGVATFGAASTGTAISTLSGAIATNATLAWFGGGALGVGGLGMAGGIAVLGGIVAAPVLVIGGLMLASKAEEIKENAYSNFEIAKVAVEEMELAKSKTIAIKKKVFEYIEILNKVSKYIDLNILNNIVSSRGYNCKDYDNKTIEQLHFEYSCYEALLNLLETKIINENGEITRDIVEQLDKNKNA
ncbi:hypothetical protein [Aliarcobacter cryaerophilus]|uniref:Glycine zipper family protein n=1 Tax=Aliarcobacter cryaerophilus TaxID=28198 RepID=A0A2S9SK88_9BACT|nr:hypothetical protein [Aliarcobacter cryaerophilus]PRM86999.1 hypothetical protein CJ669_09765 [Aliarcobacter cryaerophilus]